MKISKSEPIEVYGDGSSKRDYTCISDIVFGVLAALDQDLGYEIFNLGNSNPIELNYFISVIEKSVGKRAIIQRMPLQEGDVEITFADTSKAEKMLGYRSKVGIEKGIKELVCNPINLKIAIDFELGDLIGV
jgi:UDP-glucuronate 4-epimerase